MNKVLLATYFLVFFTLFGFIVSDRPNLEDDFVRKIYLINIEFER